MAKLIFLGTSGAVGSKERDNTSFLIQNKKELLLIDTPGSLVSKLDKINIDFRKIKNIIITHSHPDHLYGIVSLIHSQYKIKNKIHIYALGKVIKLIKILQKIFSLKDKKLYPELAFHPLKRKKQPFYKSGSLSIFFFKTKHSQDSIGLKIIFKDKVLVISGDSPFDENIIKEAKNCDFLIHDCFAPQKFFKKYPLLNQKHTSSLNLGKIAYLSKTKNLIPIHFSGELKYDFGKIIKEIRKNYSGKVIIPSDLTALKL